MVWQRNQTTRHPACGIFEGSGRSITKRVLFLKQLRTQQHSAYVCDLQQVGFQ